MINRRVPPSIENPGYSIQVNVLSFVVRLNWKWLPWILSNEAVNRFSKKNVDPETMYWQKISVVFWQTYLQYQQTNHNFWYCKNLLVI